MLERCSLGEDDFPPVKASPNLGFLGENVVRLVHFPRRGANPFPVRWGEILASTALSYLEYLIKCWRDAVREKTIVLLSPPLQFYLVK